MNAEQIASLIPHAGSMCLLNRVVSHSVNNIVCTAMSHQLPTNPLRERGMLAAACGVEYAAQAMALHGALLAKTVAQDSGVTPSPRGGRLASVRSVDIFVRRLDDIQGELTIEATQIMGDANNMMYEFSVSASARPLLQGKATVILVAQNNP
jgi:predicted hotdog family 3-hydroxylacyl-ACP dehydratase